VGGNTNTRQLTHAPKRYYLAKLNKFAPRKLGSNDSSGFNALANVRSGAKELTSIYFSRAIIYIKVLQFSDLNHFIQAYKSYGHVHGGME
jgi:hypothetical protein